MFIYQRVYHIYLYIDNGDDKPTYNWEGTTLWECPKFEKHVMSVYYCHGARETL